MSEPTDPREIRHNAGIVGLNPVPPSENGKHHHNLTTSSSNPVLKPSDLPQHDYGAYRFHEDAEKFPGLTPEQVKSDLRLMDPQTIRERHMLTMLPRTSFDRDHARQQRAAAACGWHQKCTQEEKRLSDRCLAIINSLEHMEIDKDIALLALEKLCGVDD